MKAIYTYDKVQFTFAEMKKKKRYKLDDKMQKTEGFTISRDLNKLH